MFINLTLVDMFKSIGIRLAMNKLNYLISSMDLSF